MIYSFNNRVDYSDTSNLNQVNVLTLSGELNPKDQYRLQKIKRLWNFYEGFHWEDIPLEDKPQITENYCRKFINRYVAFEMGKGFNLNVPIENDFNNEKTPITNFLNNVWEDNDKNMFCANLGQSKSITGDGWVQVKFEAPNKNDDPFNEYPKGRIKLYVIPTGIVFPTYDPHDKDKITSIMIIYPIEVEEVSPILRKHKIKKVVYKQYWDKDKIIINEDGKETLRIPNKYGVIPFIQIKNLSITGKEEGLSDLEDIIPLNMELNLKKSDISEIIDYHSSPVTVVYGAKVSNLQKGANKVWGGLPKDAKVENLSLEGDMSASINYIDDLKSTLYSIGGLTENLTNISNTSGVALQLMNLDLIEKTRMKRLCSSVGIEYINKLILYIGLKEGLIKIPTGVNNKDFYKSEVTFPDTLPKDKLLELQQIQIEMQIGIESRKGAMKRLGKKDIQKLLDEINKDIEKNNGGYYGKGNDMQNQQQINSGFDNGSEPKPKMEVNTSFNGQNAK